ncbi:hypothetical protein SAMN05216188_101814 [Lentzea xinjiangensis]|uniref:Uncharacterized protein n=1 Tax=Lentzea xinjiangensis TaxID=402600 RepID=A0A1H9BJM1_9PSEU|nr:hypothetical protein [Lentzea xinjiangensis]SEP88917.1 hypothetical protein SAMN05216188_101814 [Lentzea xinjiangensis]
MSASEALSRFRAEVGAAVTRARRAAGEVGERNAKLRERTRDLAERARARTAGPGAPATSAQLRESATAFRRDRGLPVEEVPDASGAAERASAGPVETEPVALGSVAVAGPSGQLPPASDDDEDFSQSRILY